MTIAVLEERALRAQDDALFHCLADGAPVGIFQTNPRGRCLFVNRRWSELTGQDLDTARGGGWVRAIYQEDRERVVREWNASTRREEDFALECRIRKGPDQVHHVLARGCPVRDPEGKVIAYLGTVTVIDELKRAEEAVARSERRYRHLVESSLGLICTHDLEGRLLSVNPAAAEALGYDADELVDRSLQDLLAPAVRKDFAGYLEQIRSSQSTSGWMRVRTRSGEERLWAYRNSVYSEEGQDPYVLGHAHDITELYRAEKAGRLLALQDEVTGLLNRRGFDAVLERQLVQAVEQRRRLELVLVNPDDFEVINDRFGRETGDRVLQEIARRLEGLDNGVVGVCRYGGAVFAFLRAAAADSGEAGNPADAVWTEDWTEKLCKALSRRAYLDDVIRLSFSAGIAIFDPERDGIADDTALRLVRRADEALNRAKGEGGATTVVWTREVETERSGHRDRLSGIFTANLAKDYRNMLLLWDTVTLVSRNPALEELTDKVLEGLRSSFKPDRVALFTHREGTSPELVRCLVRHAGDWDLGRWELDLIACASRERKTQHAETSAEEAEAGRSLFAVPLIARGECLGCLYLDGRTDLMALDPSDRTFLEALADRLAVAFARAKRVEEDRKRQAEERRRLRQEIDDLGQALQRAKLVVFSPQMQAVLDQARRVAPTDATVLIHGPSGTGKEVLARTLHELSPRRSKPPVVVDCTAIAPSLIESELFGHEKGAFTGADQKRTGRLAEAEGSTVILDEIGELPLTVQSKLLRFVQEQELMSVGGRRVVKIDTRVVAATHRDLTAEVAAGRFREDLFHRLNVVRLTLPPLAERPEDIQGLAQHFLTTFAQQHRKEIPDLEEDAEAALLRHSWPGNVRELQNRILRAVILDETGRIHAEDLGLGSHLDSASPTPTRARSRPDATRESEGAQRVGEGPDDGHSVGEVWHRLREALTREVEAALEAGRERRFPLGRWLQEDLVLEAAEVTPTQREAAERLDLPETTLRRRLGKALAEVESGRAVRSPSWGIVRRLLRELVERANGANPPVPENGLPKAVLEEKALPDRLRTFLLLEVDPRVSGSTRRGAALLGVSEPTYRRWIND